MKPRACGVGGRRHYKEKTRRACLDLPKELREEEWVQAARWAGQYPVLKNKNRVRAEDRYRVIVKLREEGWPMRAIGALYGISKQRIAQILDRGRSVHA